MSISIGHDQSHEETNALVMQYLETMLQQLNEHHSTADKHAGTIAELRAYVSRLEAKNLELSRALEQKNGRMVALCRKCRRQL